MNAEDVQELGQHLQESLFELLQSGLTEEEAWLIATRRLGAIQLLEDEFQKVQPLTAGTGQWVLLLWGATGGLLLQMLVVLLPTFLFTKWRHDGQPLYYGLATFVLLLVPPGWWRRSQVGAWLGQQLPRLSVAGLFTVLILGLLATTLAAWIIAPAYSLAGGRQAHNTLVFCFYLAVFLSTAYGTLRQRIAWQSLEAFRQHLTGPSCCLLGFMAQILVQYTYGFQVLAAPLLVGLLLYSLLGWLLQPTRHPLQNLCLAQLSAGSILIFGLLVNDVAKAEFLLCYGAAVLGLGLGYYSVSIKSSLRLPA